MLISIVTGNNKTMIQIFNKKKKDNNKINKFQLEKTKVKKEIFQKINKINLNNNLITQIRIRTRQRTSCNKIKMYRIRKKMNLINKRNSFKNNCQLCVNKINNNSKIIFKKLDLNNNNLKNNRNNNNNYLLKKKNLNNNNSKNFKMKIDK